MYLKPANRPMANVQFTLSQYRRWSTARSGAATGRRRGPRPQKAILSVLETCKQQLVSGFEYVSDTLCHGFASLFTQTPNPASTGR